MSDWGQRFQVGNHKEQHLTFSVGIQDKDEILHATLLYANVIIAIYLRATCFTFHVMYRNTNAETYPCLLTNKKKGECSFILGAQVRKQKISEKYYILSSITK